jgi:hypothetical protein
MLCQSDWENTMIREPQTNGHGTKDFPAEGVRRNVMNFAHDVWELAELQCQLAKRDTEEASSRVMTSLVLAGGAMVFALSAVPILLLAVGWILVYRAGLPHDGAFAIVAAVAFITAGVLGWISWRTLRNAAGVFKRSAGELGQNLRWIKSSLKTQPCGHNADRAATPPAAAP